VAVTASATLKPTKHTATSATYTLPAGTITVAIGGTTYATTGTSTLEYGFPIDGRPDTMVVTATVSGSNVTVVGIASLATDSFTKAVTKHPERFTPAPQVLTPAETAQGAGSKLHYFWGASQTWASAAPLPTSGLAAQRRIQVFSSLAFRRDTAYTQRPRVIPLLNRKRGKIECFHEEGCCRCLPRCWY
jgi:hypothetical protein